MTKQEQQLAMQIGSAVNGASEEAQRFIVAIMAAYDAGKAAGAKSAAVA